MKLSNNRVLVGIGPITYLGRGGYKWPCRFQLEKTAEEDGWIIQEIDVAGISVDYKQLQEDCFPWQTAELKDSLDKKSHVPPQTAYMIGGAQQKIEFVLRPVTHYWEAWELKKGTKVIYSVVNRPYDDEYEESSKPANSAGRSKVSGWLQFYHGELPSDFVKNNPKTSAAFLRSTPTMPEFWSRSNAARHDLECTWNGYASVVLQIDSA